MSPDDPRHGSRRGYYAHRRDDEQACAACKRGAAGAEQLRQMRVARGVSGRVSPVGMRRRLQALAALGYTWRSLDRELNTVRMVEKWSNEPRIYIYATSALKVAQLYDRLSMRLPPERTQHEKISAARARSLARRMGWPPPLAWDDIDNPDEKPRGLPTPTRKESADLTVADWDMLRRNGYTRAAAAEYMGISKKRLEKAIERTSRRLAEAS